MKQTELFVTILYSEESADRFGQIYSCSTLPMTKYVILQEKKKYILLCPRQKKKPQKPYTNMIPRKWMKSKCLFKDIDANVVSFIYLCIVARCFSPRPLYANIMPFDNRMDNFVRGFSYPVASVCGFCPCQHTCTSLHDLIVCISYQLLL